ncbi:MAG: hypothetical protein ACTSVD_07395 [Candidatus Thorarchaeota archaeon]|nr:MAG: hypothetical protein DRO73_00600 [Candidatus Thorarchaeota archaeon]RLI61426.1 MAG: hypothetical protein DRO93_04275 [Candidatus Thorarchaeota archaeon]
METRDGAPLAECDNASRVIKYVAVLGYCYSSYDVVEMRVHDINVVADFNRHDPTLSDSDAPVVDNGVVVTLGCLCDGWVSSDI